MTIWEITKKLEHTICECNEFGNDCHTRVLAGSCSACLKCHLITELLRVKHVAQNRLDKRLAIYRAQSTVEGCHIYADIQEEDKNALSELGIPDDALDQAKRGDLR